MLRAIGTGVVLLVMIGASSLFAQDSTQAETDALPEYEPTHRVRFPGSPNIRGITFSADGHSIFVHLQDLAINLWEVLVYYWPEVLGTLTAVTTIVCTIALWRITHRKRLVGEPHCRQCNYCLKGCESERCPECGAQIKRPVIGRSMRRRTWPFAAPLVFMLALYGSLWLLRVPRSGYVRDWIHWWSYGLAAWACESNSPLADRWGRLVNRIVEVDVATGELLETSVTWGSSQLVGFPITLTPDGAHLLMTLQDHDRLSLISTRSGRVVKRLSYGKWPKRRISRWRQVAGFDDAGKTVYLVAFDQKGHKTYLLAWEWQSDQTTVLLESDAETQSSKPGPTTLPREYHYIPGTSPPHFLELPASYRVGDEAIEILVRDSSQPNRVVTRFSTTLWAYFDTPISPDGKSVFVYRRDSENALTEFDLSTGAFLSIINAPAGHRYGPGQTDKSRRLLVVTGECLLPTSRRLPYGAGDQPGAPVFLVRDMVRKRWVGRYAVPEHWLPREPCVSPDGCRFAAWGCEVGDWGNDGLLIYELRSSPQEVGLSKESSW